MTKGRRNELIKRLNLDSIAQKEMYAALENNLRRKIQELTDREFEAADDVLKKAKSAIRLARIIDRENKSNQEVQVYLALKSNPSNPVQTLKKSTSAERVLRLCQQVVGSLGLLGAYISSVPLIVCGSMALFFGIAVPVFATVMFAVTGILAAIYLIIRAASAIHRSRINSLVKRVEQASNTPPIHKKIKSDNLPLATAILCKSKAAKGAPNWPFALISKKKGSKQSVTNFCLSTSVQIT